MPKLVLIGIFCRLGSVLLKRVKAEQLEKDAVIELFDLRLRIVRSPKDGKNDEPWYILTNDFSSSRAKVIRIYYHRFEIEEDFKDIKHILGLKRTRFNNPNSLKVILWLMALGMALLYLVTKQLVRTTQAAHPKKQRSWFRIAFEAWQRSIHEHMVLTG